VFTQTRPGPPPGAAAVRVVASDFAFAGAAVAAPAVAGLGDVFGLNKSANVFFAGEAVAAGEGEARVVFFRAPFDAGSISG